MNLHLSMKIEPTKPEPRISDLPLPAGTDLGVDEAIALVEGAFPKKKFCLVRDWAIIDIETEAHEKESVAALGVQPSLLRAGKVIYDSARRWSYGDLLHRSTGLVSLTQGCFFETKNTVYVLCGRGRRLLETKHEALKP